MSVHQGWSLQRRHTKSFGDVHEVVRKDPRAQIPDASLQLTGDLLITEVDLSKQLVGLNKNRCAGPNDVYPAIIEIIADSMARPVCRLFQASVDQGKNPRIYTDVDIQKGCPRLSWTTSSQAA